MKKISEEELHKQTPDPLFFATQELYPILYEPSPYFVWEAKDGKIYQINIEKVMEYLKSAIPEAFKEIKE